MERATLAGPLSPSPRDSERPSPGPVVSPDRDRAAAIDIATTIDRRRGWAARLWRSYVSDIRTEADAHADAYLEANSAAAAARRVAGVVGVTMASLALIQLLKNAAEPDWLLALLRTTGLDGTAFRLEEAVLTSANAQFNRLVWWSVVQIAGYTVLPVLLITVGFRESVRDFGLRLTGTGRQAAAYLLLLALVLPPVIAASFTGPFQARYPFYDPAPAEAWWPFLWTWWALYALQFVALEFFFRGFLLFGLERVFGYTAVFLMIIPYVMIHFQKPALEAVAAIIAGFVLGTLALKTRSIWWGAALHVAVAMAMDLSALTHKGLFL